MHIPDGFLDAKTLAVTGALSAGGLAVAARQVNRTLPRNKIPLMGLSAAFVFAAQMLNFPVAGGTSGHLLGGVLAAVLIGPGAAAIVIACVLLVQALIFSDGGVLALGANIFNMAFIGAVVGYAIYCSARKFLPGLRGRITAVFFAAWLSTVLAAVTCAGELSLSGTLAPGVVFPAMVGVHALIGIGEGLITSLVILAIARTRPDLLDAENAPAARGAGLGISGVRSGHRAGVGDFCLALRLLVAGRTGQGGGEIRLCRPRRHAHQDVDSRLQNAGHQFGGHRHGHRRRARHAGHVRAGLLDWARAREKREQKPVTGLKSPRRFSRGVAAIK